jgi:hypothetical protein
MYSPEVTPVLTEAESPYMALIKQIHESEQLPPPQSAEEATQRVMAAQDAYEGLEPPAVSMPDTPDRTLKELLEDRQRQYWMDRGEIREGDMKAVESLVGFMDSSPANNMMRIMANSPEDMPKDVLLWAVAKTMLAGKAWQEVQGAWAYSRQHDDLDIDMVADTDSRSELVAVMYGRARAEIREGKPVLVPNDFATASQAVGAEIHRRHLSWQERHDIMSRSGKLKVAVPLLVDALTSARSVWSVGDLAQFHWGEYYGYGDGKQVLEAERAAKQN